MSFSSLTLTLPVGEAVKAAVSNLWTLRQRSALALLGIVIGAAAVVAMLTIGRIAETESLRLFDKIQLDVLLATISGADPSSGFDAHDVERLPQRLSLANQATPLAVGHLDVPGRQGDQELDTLAATSALLPLAGLELAQGRFLENIDADNFVAVIGADVSAILAQAGRRADVGGAVRIGNNLFKVIGVLRPREATAFDPANFNRTIVIPLDLRNRSPEHLPVNAALIHAVPGTDTDVAIAQIQAALSLEAPKAQVQVRSARQLVTAMKAQKVVQTRLLAAIGAISLLVGGIGVMNVMLMGVMERRREIGLRAAIGATPADIQLMFLLEAGILATVGGLAGAALGVAAAAVAAKASGWAFSMNWSAAPLGALMAALVGLAFGLYPAVKASRLDPIEALRAE